MTDSRISDSDDWTLAVDRAELTRTTLTAAPAPTLGPGEALLRPSRVGLTANNVTYALLGDAFGYWRFFPAEPAGLDAEWGLVPLWGFADVVGSTIDGVEVGQRVYGYLPPSGLLRVRPNRVDERGFRDGSAHRAELPSPYNVYALTTGDSAYERDREDLLVLYRPLFFTSFMLADELADRQFGGASTLVFSSASSKTAYGTAYLLCDQDVRVVGLTSPGNIDFTRSLGCYDEVVPYGGIGELDPAAATGYVDFAGSDRARAEVRERLGSSLRFDTVVGMSHQAPDSMAGEVFFAPNQMRKRSQDWGRDGLDAKFAEAWQGFAAAVEGWVDVRIGHGPEALRAAWLEVLAGHTPPRTGHVIVF
jgi:hypothetical protein